MTYPDGSVDASDFKPRTLWEIFQSAVAAGYKTSIKTKEEFYERMDGAESRTYGRRVSDGSGCVCRE